MMKQLVTRLAMLGIVIAEALYGPVEVYGAACAGRNQSCTTKPCCDNLGLACVKGSCKAVTATTVTPTTQPGVSTTRPSPTTTTLPSGPPPTQSLLPIRPRPRDVSTRLPKGSALAYFQGHLTWQYPRRILQDALLAWYLPRAVEYAMTIPGCQQALHGTIDNDLSELMTKLYPEYWAKCCEAPHAGTRNIPDEGLVYAKPQYALGRIQDCSTTSVGAAQCGKSPLMNLDLQDLLDLRLELTPDGPVCVVGAPFEYADPIEGRSGPFEQSGPINTRHPQAPARALAELHASHECHAQASARKCNPSLPAPTCSAQAGHAAFEAREAALAPNNKGERLNFAAIDSFSGFAAPGWTERQLCRFATVQDQFHAKWMTAIERGDWGAAVEASIDHLDSHLCQSYPPELHLTARFSCGQFIDKCPVVTCASVAGAP